MTKQQQPVNTAIRSKVHTEQLRLPSWPTTKFLNGNLKHVTAFTYVCQRSPVHNLYFYLLTRHFTQERITPGPKSLDILNFVSWGLIFVDPQHWNCLMSPFCRLECSCSYQSFGKFVNHSFKYYPSVCTYKKISHNEEYIIK